MEKKENIECASPSQQEKINKFAMKKKKKNKIKKREKKSVCEFIATKELKREYMGSLHQEKN
jgi:hypothetical protein